jgi:hypothetical protein
MENRPLAAWYPDFAPFPRTHQKETMMLRLIVKRALRALLPVVVLVGGVALPLESGPAHAAIGPKLTIRCFGAKAGTQASCWTWGNSFAGNEWVHLTYYVTFLTMPKVNGQRPSKTFRRAVKTNSSGTLTRTPRVTFPTVKKHNTFKIAVTAVGALKDKGTTSLAEIGT